MRYASVCDGIGAVHVAWQPLGWECAWTSEIDAFPAAVVEQRWGFPNRGDMTRFRDWGGLDVDLLVGGTPCQAFSVAGLRRSLEDERGNLSLVFVNLMDAIDEERKRLGKPPAICVWENVPGVLSTKDNAFGCFLAGLAGEGVPLQPSGGKWSNAGYVLGPKRAVAWRVLDAQYFGVAQRRRRVFLVASARDGCSPAAVLFESEGMRRDHAPSREKGQGTTYDVAPCVGASGRGFERAGETRGQDPVVAQPIWRAGDQANSEHCYGHAGTLNCDKGQQGGIVAFPDPAYAISAGSQSRGGVFGSGRDSQDTFVTQAFYSTESRCDGIPEPGVSPPLKVGSNGGGQPPAVAFSHSAAGNSHGIAYMVEGTPPLRGGGAGNSMPAVAYTKAKRAQSTTDDESWVPGEVAPTFNCFDQGDTRAKTVVAYDVHGTLAKKGASETDVHTALRSRSPGQSEASTTTVVAFTQNSRDEVRQINGDGQLAGALSAEAGMHQTNYIAFAQNQLGEVRTNSEVMGTVNTNQNASGRNTPMVMQAQGFTHSGYSNKPAWITGDRTDCLPSSGHGDTSHQGIGVMTPMAVRTAQTSANGHGVSEGVCHTLDQAQGQAVMTPMAVRRLTPMECERLQGFPDHYTAIEYRKKPAADGPRYKALGNSMAVPVMAWIGQRIAKCAIH